MANIVQVVLQGVDKLTGPFTVALNSTKNIEKAFNGLATATLAAGTTAVTTLTALTISAINTADEMGKMAQRIGMPVEALSRLAFAAKLSNVANEQLETGLKKLSNTLTEAAGNSSSKAAEAFRAMGVSITDVQGRILPMETIILSLSDKFASYRDGVEKTALAQLLFGRSGADMIPLLNQGADAIRQTGREANVVTDEMAAQADQYKANIDRLKNSLAALGFQVAEQLLPLLTRLTDALVRQGKEFGNANGAVTVFVGSLKTLATALALVAAGAEVTVTTVKSVADLIKDAVKNHGVAGVLSGSGLITELITSDAKALADGGDKLQALGKRYREIIDSIWQTGQFTPGLPGAPSRGAMMARIGIPGAPSESAPNVTAAEEAAKHLKAQQDLFDAMIAQERKFLADRNAQWARADIERRENERRGQQAILSLTGQMFGTMGRLAATYGEKNFALQQAFQIGQAIMNTALGVTRAYAEHTWPYSSVVAGIVAALGAAEIAIIAGSKPGGQAHGGLDWVPDDSTFLLKRGERVLQPEANVALMDFLEGQRSQATHVIVNLDGRPILDTIQEASRDGRLEIHARAVAA